MHTHMHSMHSRQRRRWTFDLDPSYLLEPRCLLSIFLVTNTADNGAGSLRQAILDSNNLLINNPENESRTEIQFNIPGAGDQVIHLASPLPSVTFPVIIAGYSQPGSHMNISPDDRPDQGDIAVPLIHLDGSQAGSNASGLTILTDNCEVSGLTITNFAGCGIELQNEPVTEWNISIGCTIWGNIIGTVPQADPELNGTPVDPSANPDANGVGVHVLGSNNRIGGTTPSMRNLIQGNGSHGVLIAGFNGTGNLIEGNFILDNGGDGVHVTTSNNFIGEPIGAGASRGGNVISGNQGAGVVVTDAGALGDSVPYGNQIWNNEIGTNIRLPNVAGSKPVRGMTARGNRLEGVRIEDAPRTVVGGTFANARNVIAANGQAGVRITGLDSEGCLVAGNYIGFNIDASVVAIMPNLDGVLIEAARNTVGGTVDAARNIISCNLHHGVEVSGSAATGNLIVGNYIGTIHGNDDFGNSFDGVHIENATNNTVGGTVSGARNVISGNNNGIVLFQATNTTIQGNYIGTTSDGGIDLGNAVNGILLIAGSNNMVGGSTPATGNVISGNNWGLTFDGAGSVGNAVQNNLIGTDATGELPLGNARDGVRFTNGASNNMIGGATPALGNIIWYNNGDGVFVESGIGNTVLSNTITANYLRGIVLGAGGNNDQPAPTITSVLTDGNQIAIQGNLSIPTAPNTAFILQLFLDPALVPGRECRAQGKILIDTRTITTDSLGQAPFDALIGQAVPVGAYMTATVTRDNGDTSRFARGIAAQSVTIALAQAAMTVNENAGTAFVVVTRTGGLGATVTVDYATADGTAVAGKNYGSTTGTLTFQPDETQKIISVPILDDGLVGPDVAFSLTLKSPSVGAVLGTITTTTVTIHETNVYPVHFEVSSVSIRETTPTLTVTVVRDGDTGPASFAYATSGGDAVPNVNYVPIQGVLNFAAGKLQASFTLSLLHDPTSSGDRTVDLVLSQPQGLTIGTPSIETVTILDDEAPSTFQIVPASYSVSERTSSVLVTVVRTGGTSQTATADFTTSESTARAGIDFVPTAGTLAFGPNETVKTFSVSILDRHLSVGSAVFSVVVQPRTGTNQQGPISAPVTIRFDEPDRIPPTVTGITLVADSRGIRNIVVSFSEALDPSRAVQLFNYNNAVLSPGRDGLFGTTDDTPVRLTRASYDPVSQRVTLTPVSPLPLNTFYQVTIDRVIVPLVGAGVADRAGNLLDGDGDGVAGGMYQTYIGLGNRLSYRDQSGDRATLQLAGGGQMLMQLGRDSEARSLQFTGAASTASVLTGAVTRARGSDGLVRIPQIDSSKGVKVRLPSPPFVVPGALKATVVKSALAKRTFRQW